MKFLSSIVVAASILFCANSSDACPGSEDITINHASDIAITNVEHTDSLATVAEAGQAAAEPTFSFTLLDHEGDSSGAFDSQDWASAIADITTDWDLTGMVGVPASSSDYDVPRRKFLVEDEDEPLASSATPIADTVESTGSNVRPPAAQMAIEGYEDR